MRKAIIYTRNGCGYCVAAKALLSEHNISFTEHLVTPTFTKTDVEKALHHYKNNIQINTVPQIVLDGQYVGGYSDLKNLLG